MSQHSDAVIYTGIEVSQRIHGLGRTIHVYFSVMAAGKLPETIDDAGNLKATTDLCSLRGGHLTRCCQAWSNNLVIERILTKG